MNEDPRRIVVQRCNRLIVLDNLTCGSCGRDVAQYRAKVGPRRLVWEHRRGAVRGQTQELRMALSVAEARLRVADARVAELEAGGSTETQRLTRIEAKLDELLKRPAGVAEWRPDHRRHADGGLPVREQRYAAGVPRRRPRVRKPLDGMREDAAS